MKFLHALGFVGRRDAKRLAALDKFIEILDRTEESDNGRVFHPVTVGCCRALWMEELNAVLMQMKGVSSHGLILQRRRA